MRIRLALVMLTELLVGIWVTLYGPVLRWMPSAVWPLVLSLLVLSLGGLFSSISTSNNNNSGPQPSSTIFYITITRLLPVSLLAPVLIPPPRIFCYP